RVGDEAFFVRLIMQPIEVRLRRLLVAIGGFAILHQAGLRQRAAFGRRTSEPNLALSIQTVSAHLNCGCAPVNGSDMVSSPESRGPDSDVVCSVCVRKFQKRRGAMEAPCADHEKDADRLC